MFNLQLLVFPTAPHSSSGRNGDSCCVFSNSCLNCAMVLFPIERPELISVWMQSQFGLGPAKHKVLWTGNILIGLAPRAFEICYWVCVRWFFSSQPIAHDQRTTEFSVHLFWNYCAICQYLHPWSFSESASVFDLEPPLEIVLFCDWEWKN